ncbi:D-alanine--D-alanine ligase family protein [Micromonospora sp. CB01531]|uniref:D-alanine--D-alanine ligase family protein n=1 Tax=Micromonospora sp. CB01531 TaxID=1718947 RepID=UPI00093A74E8|nr:D-alanine--D-alanine ligase family protein [Micromonospora sp. CB01531]OKI48978.1 D-alanine--D-alanine ligase [Micromonospora sp. CB01531]
MSTRLAVLFGGRSGEHEVSRRSAESILAHLDREAYDVTEVLIERDGRWAVNGSTLTFGAALEVLRRQDVVFPALHGPYGEDGTVQSMLEFLGVAYVGNGVFASAAGMDKTITKRLLTAEGLRVADEVSLRPGEDLSAADRKWLGLPVFVKPRRSGSSLGVSKVDDWSQLPAAIALARESDSRILVERAIRGREIDVAVLQFPDGRIEAGPPLEINVSSAAFFDYEAKYEGGAVFDIPAKLDPDATQMLQDRAVHAFRVLGCRALLRVDFFLPHGETEPVLNEVNTFPGFTAASQYPQIWQRAGIEFPVLLDILIEGALRRPAMGDRVVADRAVR